MAIKDGSLASADEVLNLTGTIFKNQAQLIYNAARIGFNSKLNVSGVPNLKNIKYDCCLTDTATTKTGFLYDSANFNYLGLGYSYADGSTIATDGSTYNINEGTNVWYDKKTFSGLDNYVYSLNCTKTRTGSQGSTYVRATFTYSDSSTASAQFGSSNASDAVVLASPSNKQHLKVTQIVVAVMRDHTNNSGTITSLSVEECLSVASPISLIFQTTSLPTITDSIATWNSVIDSENTLTVSISADGTNYEEVTDATIHRFTNTGTNLFVKFVITRVDTAAIDKISEYAVLYNTGAE